MIEDIHVTDLGVVAEATIRPARGLTAITGETGTGKTMVLTSLGLLLGRRADPALVRHGAQRARVEGTVVLDEQGEAGVRAADAGAQFDEGALLVTRTVPAQGRSKAHLGGSVVPSSLLGEVLGAGITVHGQADQLRLKSPDAQREALDAAAGREHATALARYAQAWEELRAARAQARAFRDESMTRRAEIAVLQDLVGRWDALEPQDGEDEALREEAARLGHVEELRAAVTLAHAALAGAEDDDAHGVTALLDQAGTQVQRAATVDRSLGQLHQRLAELGYLAADVASELSSYLAGLEGDPARLEQVHRRIAALNELTRGHEDLAAMAAEVAQARARLTELTGPGADGEAIQQRLDAAAQQVREAGASVSEGRRLAAAYLSGAIDKELAGLAMSGAHLSVELPARERPGAHGLEDVEFLLRPHPGAPARPLGQGASGGELSRVMLALELVLARAHGAAQSDEHADGHPQGREVARPTMVFDEIDAGIGGRTAIDIGRRLAGLAEHVQVIVVTHLAQVASFADTHLVVAKATDGEQTTTTVTEVEGQARIDELARMLSGMDSATAREHAAELIARAGVGD